MTKPATIGVVALAIALTMGACGGDDGGDGDDAGSASESSGGTEAGGTTTPQSSGSVDVFSMTSLCEVLPQEEIQAAFGDGAVVSAPDLDFGNGAGCSFTVRPDPSAVGAAIVVDVYVDREFEDPGGNVDRIRGEEAEDPDHEYEELDIDGAEAAFVSYDNPGYEAHATASAYAQLPDGGYVNIDVSASEDVTDPTIFDAKPGLRELLATLVSRLEPAP